MAAGTVRTVSPTMGIVLGMGGITGGGRPLEELIWQAVHVVGLVAGITVLGCSLQGHCGLRPGMAIAAGCR